MIDEMLLNVDSRAVTENTNKTYSASTNSPVISVTVF